MKKHLDNLIESFPNILSKKILDIGAGRGSFMVDAMRRGASVSGVEYKSQYIDIAQNKAKEFGLKLDILQGVGESLPYFDKSFGFANLCEVLEHVQDPKKVLEETFRVLEVGGEAYLSVPNRFGLKDQHFHLYFINWLPRFLSDFVIAVFGRHKSYDGTAGLQRLSEMHYFTYGSITKLAQSIGFKSQDIREEKLNKRFDGFPRYIALFLYKIVRSFYFDSFHLKLVKK